MADNDSKPVEPCWVEDSKGLNRKHLSWQVAVTAGFGPGKLGLSEGVEPRCLKRGRALASQHKLEGLFEEGVASLREYLQHEGRALRVLNRVARATSWFAGEGMEDMVGPVGGSGSSQRALEAGIQTDVLATSRTIVRHLGLELDSERAFVGLLDHTSRTFDVAVADDKREQQPTQEDLRSLGRLVRNASLAGWSVNAKSGFLSGDIEAEGEQQRLRGWFHFVQGWQHRSVVCAPLLAELGDGDGLRVIPIGTLCFEDGRENHFDEEDLLFLLLSAKIVASRILSNRRWHGVEQAIRHSLDRTNLSEPGEFQELAERMLVDAIKDLRGASDGAIVEYFPGTSSPLVGLAVHGANKTDKALAPEDIGAILSDGSLTLQACETEREVVWPLGPRDYQEATTARIFAGVVSTIVVPIPDPSTGAVIGALTIESSASVFDAETGGDRPIPVKQSLEEQQRSVEETDVKHLRLEPFTFYENSAEALYLRRIAKSLGYVLAAKRRRRSPTDTGGSLRLGKYYLPKGSKWIRKMLKAVNLAKIAGSRLPVVLIGERGTGKALLARAIHDGDAVRNDRPFVIFDASAHPPDLIESALFGHAEGAFTGARKSRIGKLEEAEGGTLFIDELQNMTPQIQAKLLVALQERRFVPVGSDEEKAVKIEAKLIFGTNADSLDDLVRRWEAGRDYEGVSRGVLLPDLRDRIDGVQIRVPALRAVVDGKLARFSRMLQHLGKRALEELKSDDGFLHHANRETSEGSFREQDLDGQEDVELLFTTGAIDLLFAHAWPGNFRELHTVLSLTILKSVRDRPLPRRRGNSKRKIRIRDVDVPERIRTASARGSEPPRASTLDRDYVLPSGPGPNDPWGIGKGLLDYLLEPRRKREVFVFVRSQLPQDRWSEVSDGKVLKFLRSLKSDGLATMVGKGPATRWCLVRELGASRAR